MSTATSIVVLSPSEPFGLELKAGGQAVPVDGWTVLGDGLAAPGWPTRYWRLRIDTSNGMLAPQTEYVLSVPSSGGLAEVTRFTTAAGYDKIAGTPPNLRGLHLWRVRYPVADIAAGGCVFAEYHTFVTVDYDPATIPNTPPDSTVQTFSLAPKTGGATHSFVYVGAEPFTGQAPEGDYPTPTAPWQPELDPTRVYCLTIGAFGDGDLARAVPASNQVCASVTQLAAPGAASSGGGGCSASGAGRAPVAVALMFLALMSALSRRRVR